MAAAGASGIHPGQRHRAGGYGSGGCGHVDWAGETARFVGTVVHRLLQHIGVMGLERLEQPGDVRELERIGYNLLKQMGVPEDGSRWHSRMCASRCRPRWMMSAAVDPERDTQRFGVRAGIECQGG